MDIIAQFKAERDKAAQQMSALYAAIKALSGLSSTRVVNGAQNDRRCTSEDRSRTKTEVG